MRKWNKGDYVSYRTNGVCRITDIVDLKLTSDGWNKYYVLSPVYKDGLTIYVDTSDKEAEDEMKAPLSTEQINALIHEAALSHLKWISNERERSSFISQKINSGSMCDLLSIVQVLQDKKKEKSGQGKKLGSTDEQNLHRAENMVNTNFAYSLGIRPDQVPAYIRQMAAAG